MHDIFISYAREDRNRVRLLAEKLIAQGCSVWWDLNILAGQSYREVIQKELEDARCVVVVWSCHSIDSHWVHGEADEGKKRNALVPITIDGTLPGLDFGQLQTLDFSDWSGDEASPDFCRLVASVEALLTDVPEGREDQKPRRASQPPPVVPGQSHWYWRGLAVFIVSVVIVGLWLSRDHELPLTMIGLDNKEMMLVQKDTFKMGVDKSEVYVDAFYIDKYEVTNGEYAHFVKKHAGRQMPNVLDGCIQDANYPVCGVRWEDAKAYCKSLGKQLPTEAQWEKAARGIDGRKYPWGNDSVEEKHANYCDQSCTSPLFRDDKHNDTYRYTAPVTAFEAGQSPYGVYNLAGNVWEWVEDQKQDNSEKRVVRGGSWYSEAEDLRTYSRKWLDPNDHKEYVGFRCVRLSKKS